MKPTNRVRVRVDFVLEFDRDLESLPAPLEDISWSSAIQEGARHQLDALGATVSVSGAHRRISLGVGRT